MRSGERKYLILKYLHEHGEATVDDLCREFGLTRGAVGSLLNLYRRQRLVDRVKVGSRYVYFLTDRGRARLEHLGSRFSHF